MAVLRSLHALRPWEKILRAKALPSPNGRRWRRPWGAVSSLEASSWSLLGRKPCPLGLVMATSVGAAPSLEASLRLSDRMHALLNYEAPESRESGIISERGDVYSFGVVMLELLTGRKPYDSSRPRSEQHLVRWASSQLHDIDSLSKMVDPSIRGQCSEKALSRFADIISRCVQQEPEFRPPMSAIVQDLARIVNANGEESE